jgi:hypothetical protein
MTRNYASLTPAASRASVSLLNHWNLTARPSLIVQT